MHDGYQKGKAVAVVRQWARDLGQVAADLRPVVVLISMIVLLIWPNR